MAAFAPGGVFHAREANVPEMRVRAHEAQRMREVPLPRPREDVCRIHIDGDIVDEAGPVTVQENGEPRAQRREVQSHDRFRRHILQDGVRLADEGIRGGV